MNQWVNKLVLGLISSGILSAMTYASYQLFVVIPEVQAKVNKIEVIEKEVHDMHNFLIYGVKP